MINPKLFISALAKDGKSVNARKKSAGICYLGGCNTENLKFSFDNVGLEVIVK
jgi:hypothetical protein